MNKETIYKLAIAPFAVLALHIIAMLVGWYEMFWWFDIPMHLLGGVAVTYSAFIVLNYFKKQNILSIKWRPLDILILLGLAALAATTWELMEFTFDIYFDTGLQGSLLDTVKDLCMGLIGGGLVAIVTTYTKKK